MDPARREFAKRTLRTLGHIILSVALVSIVVYTTYEVDDRGGGPCLRYDSGEFDLGDTFGVGRVCEERGPLTVAFLFESAQDALPVAGFFALLSTPFYWLAHYLRLGREEKRSRGNQK